MGGNRKKENLAVIRFFSKLANAHIVSWSSIFKRVRKIALNLTKLPKMQTTIVTKVCKTLKDKQHLILVFLKAKLSIIRVGPYVST